MAAYRLIGAVLGLVTLMQVVRDSLGQLSLAYSGGSEEQEHQGTALTVPAMLLAPDSCNQ